MSYSCTHMTAVGVKRLIAVCWCQFVHFSQFDLLFSSVLWI